VVHRAAERETVLQRRGELVEQHVPAAVHADQVGIGDPDHVDALFPQPLADRGHVWCLRHGDSPSRTWVTFGNKRSTAA
jgi:hypothetical protein